MRTFVIVSLAAALFWGPTMNAQEQTGERQITFGQKNHMLDNNDNYSPDMRFLAYDTRETVGPGLDNCQTIEMVEIGTGEVTVLYAPETLTGEQAAPGLGAVSFSPTAMEVVFIHGPLIGEVEERGYYGMTNRKGAVVPADGSGEKRWLDFRDVATDRDTIPGAHRGGTHRHEYALDGRRVGFTYDDYLMQAYGRTIGYLEPHPAAPQGASHYFALLVPIVPEGTAAPGELERAAGDSWVGHKGQMRAFIGKVREEDGSYQESLFAVDVPADVDITTADAGSAQRFPTPPQGVRVRRLTHDWAGGIVRGTADGRRIAYYAKAEDGSTQVFIIPSDGSDQHEEPSKRPVQATRLPAGAGPSLRWHPSGEWILCQSEDGIAVTYVGEGERFGRSYYVTPHSDGQERNQAVWSPDGESLAYNKATPTYDADGNRIRTYAGKDFSQIFVTAFDREALSRPIQ